MTLLILGVTPDLRFRLESPQCTQSAVPSEVRFAVAEWLQFPTPDNEPVAAGALQATRHASRSRFFCIELKPIETADEQNWLVLRLYSTLKTAFACCVNGA